MEEYYYLCDYIEEFYGEFEGLELVKEFEIGDEKYSILKRDDGVEFVVFDYNGGNEYIWVRECNGEGMYSVLLEYDNENGYVWVSDDEWMYSDAVDRL